jgi:3-isopropylmalate/(R)-2-methylmalate dehydratase small subunit
MKEFGGSVLFLDRSDINTDEIIPAKYLTEVTKEALKPYLLEDLVLEGFNPNSDTVKNAKVIVTKENFGCGSSREHAPWALEVNDIFVVLAESYARIFRQNMFNCGMLAVELSKEEIDSIFALESKGCVECGVDNNSKKLTFSVDGKEELSFGYSITEFDEALVAAGGWVEFADKNY